MIFQNKPVEVFEFKGQVLFNPYNCGECLELAESSIRNHLANMNSNQAILLKNSDVRDKDFRKLNNAGEKFLTESGVYKLIFKSHKEEAEKFQDWVTDEVLPSIRKTGSYNPTGITKAEIIAIIKDLPNDRLKNELSMQLMSLLPVEQKQIPVAKLSKEEVRDILDEFLEKDNVILRVVEQGLAVNKEKLYKHFKKYRLKWTESLRILDEYGFIYHKDDCRTVQVRIEEEKNPVRAVVLLNK